MALIDLMRSSDMENKPPILKVDDIQRFAGRPVYLVDAQEFEVNYDNDRRAIRYRVVVIDYDKDKEVYTAFLSKTRMQKLIKSLMLGGFVSQDVSDEATLRAEMYGCPLQVTFDTVNNPRTGKPTEVVTFQAFIGKEKRDPTELFQAVLDKYPARVLSPEARSFASRLLGRDLNAGQQPAQPAQPQQSQQPAQQNQGQNKLPQQGSGNSGLSAKDIESAIQYAGGAPDVDL